jgi:outer membrane protein TolC
MTLQAGVPIFTGGKITNAIREAKAGAKGARDVANDTDAGAVFEAERNYLSVLLTADIVRLNESALASYKEHLDHAQSAFREGTAARYDVIRAEAAVSEQEKRLIEARNEFDLAVAALRTSLVLTDATPIEVAGALFEIGDPVDLSEALKLTVKNNPTLQALHEKIAANKSGVRVQQGDYLPQITGIAGRELVTSKLAQTDPKRDRVCRARTSNITTPRTSFGLRSGAPTLTWCPKDLLLFLRERQSNSHARAFASLRSDSKLVLEQAWKYWTRMFR